MPAQSSLVPISNEDNTFIVVSEGEDMDIDTECASDIGSIIEDDLDDSNKENRDPLQEVTSQEVAIKTKRREFSIQERVKVNKYLFYIL